MGSQIGRLGHMCSDLAWRHRRGRIGREPVVGGNHLVAEPRLDRPLTRGKRTKALTSLSDA